MDYQEQMYANRNNASDEQGASAAAGAQQGGTYHQAPPQPGGLYQYQPGLGFVAVQPGPAPGAQQGPPPGMHPGMQGDPGAQYATGHGGQAPGAGMPGTPEGAEPKFDQNRMGEVYGMVNDVMNGEADTSKLFGMLSGNGGDFWKGALVGAAAVFLMNNDAVKDAVSGTFGAFFGGETEEPEGE